MRRKGSPWQGMGVVFFRELFDHLTSARMLVLELKGDSCRLTDDQKRFLELARAVGSFPDQLIVFGIEAAGFDLGHGLTPEVSRAVDQAATAILEEVLACTNTP